MATAATVPRRWSSRSGTPATRRPALGFRLCSSARQRRSRPARRVRSRAMATYVTNLVQLIGLGIAIDYSLLVVYRFREELAKNGSVDEAIARTMKTAGRAVVFSGATVAIGLALLLFMPSPFMRSMGIGGFLIPLVSMAAALTLQPALLSLYGRRGVRRAAFVRRARDSGRRGFWERLA